MIEVDQTRLIQPVRLHDRSVISEFRRIGFAGAQLVALKVVANFKCVLHLSDLACCDGVTVDNWVLTDEPGESTHTFPHERPRASDFTLWNDAIRALTHGELRLPHSLGPFLREPHITYDWRTHDSADRLFRIRQQQPEPMYDVFEKDTSSVATRHGQRYIWSLTCFGELPGDNFATVNHVNEQVVTLHSKARCHVEESVPMDFWSVLRSYPNQSLWKHFVCADDGEWIRRGVLLGSLCIVHDGSYMSTSPLKSVQLAFTSTVNERRRSQSAL